MSLNCCWLCEAFSDLFVVYFKLLATVVPIIAVITTANIALLPQFPLLESLAFPLVDRLICVSLILSLESIMSISSTLLNQMQGSTVEAQWVGYDPDDHTRQNAQQTCVISCILLSYRK